MSEVVHVLGEGGAVFEMTLPLQKHIQQRLDRGDLAIVDGPDAAEDAPAPRRRTPAKPAAKQS